MSDNDAAKPVPPPVPPPGSGEVTIFRPSTSAPDMPESITHLHHHGAGLVGRTLNDLFRIDRLIGSGGTGETYQASSLATGELLAIKLITPALLRDAEQLSRFRAEARMLTRIDHPSVLRYRAAGIDPQTGANWLAFDYIDGRPLDERLGGRDPDGAMTLIRRLSGALQAVHDAGVLHLDISPGNIMLRNGSMEHPVLIDFGIARLQTAFLESATIASSGFAGKAGYAAPETFGLFQGRTGPWTDIYSLGIVAYELATGRRFHAGGSLIDAIEARRHLPDLTGVPAELARILEGMLQPDPGQRIRRADTIILTAPEPTPWPEPPTTFDTPGSWAAAAAPSEVPMAAEPRSRAHSSTGLFGRLRSMFSTSIGGPHGPGGSEDD